MHVTPRLLRRAVAPAILVTLAAAACSRDLTDPAGARSLADGARRTATDAGRPQLISNAVKYRDAGAKPATGRSGSSTLAARALLGKDGVTTLEVTTGSFDADPATRPLRKVQVKQLDGDGNALRTLNYNGLEGGGTAAFDYTGLARGQTLQVQGNVEEPRRTAVVTVAETVHLRPDLQIRLEAPDRARPGFPVTLLAVVSEANGDVGARADCVLYVDGVEADRARGIWVDAGDAVSCAFAYVFQTPGEKQLRVEAAGVDPADFEPANNVAQGTIRITSDSDFTYTAVVEDYVQTGISIDTMDVYYDDGTRSASHVVMHDTTTIQSGAFYGWTDHSVTLENTRVRVSQATNGVTVHSADWPSATGHEYPPVSGDPNCMSRWTDGTIFYLCTSTAPEFPSTSFQYVRGGVAVVYHGVRHDAYWWSDAPENVYTVDYDWSSGYSYDAPQITVGADYSFMVELTDGGQTYRAEATVPLGPPETSTWTYYPPDGTECSDTYYPESALRWVLCRYHRGEVTTRRAFVNYFRE